MNVSINESDEEERGTDDSINNITIRQTMEDVFGFLENNSLMDGFEDEDHNNS